MFAAAAYGAGVIAVMQMEYCTHEEAAAQTEENAFAYVHDPGENPEATADIVESADAVYRSRQPERMSHPKTSYKVQ